MSTHTKLNPIPQDILILWGEYFDETATAIFVSQFRQVGLRVRVIGLLGRHSTGLHKLEICADMTLGEALLLKIKASCILAPCSGAALRKYEHDPRLSQLLKQVYTPNTYIIVQELQTIDSAAFRNLSLSLSQLFIYNTEINLIAFAEQMVKLLQI